MDQKIQQELLDKSSKFLAEASKALGSTITHVYEVLVRQQVISGIGELGQIGLWFLIVGIVNFIYWKWVRSSWKAWDADDNFDAKVASCFGGGLVMIVIALGMLAITSIVADGIQHILNPEYYAIQFIFDAAKGN